MISNVNGYNFLPQNTRYASGSKPDVLSSFGLGQSQGASSTQKASKTAQANPQQSKQASNSANALSYFQKASSPYQGNQVAVSSSQKSPEQNRVSQINEQDRVKFSSEAKQEMKAEQENEHQAFSMKSSLNMNNLMKNLDNQGGSGQVQSANKGGGMSLAQKLEMVSMKSTGRAWE